MSAKLPEADAAQYPPELELTLLQVVHRHGERTPVRARLTNIIPAVWQQCEANMHMMFAILDFNKEHGFRHAPLRRLVEVATDQSTETIGPGACHYGQLTNMGRQSMAALGHRLREIYVNRLKFLPDIYDDKTVFVRSTDYPRTQDSVQQLLASGLYPAEKRNADFVMTIRSRDSRTDNMFPNPNCYRLRQLSKDFTRVVADMSRDKFASLSQRLKAYVDDVSFDSHPSANGLLDTLISAKTHGYELPKEIDDQLLRDLEDLVVNEWFYGAMQSNEVRRLGLGRLAGEIKDRMVRRANGTDKQIGEDNYKLAIYSGHDTTIAPLLIILGGFDKRWPPFGSSIIFELFKQKGQKEAKDPEHFVRVRFNNQVLQLPGCAQQGNHHENGDKTLCTLKAFQEIVKEQIPEHWEKECQI